ncbi:hypothetical protein LCGC14_2334110 [marine sediment metagenome]|uniref:Uncharacterized protein n=1 Tax=marine sediment metagenome TaxID=412755 RepID=A0A0F9CET4_9ZZZZ
MGSEVEAPPVETRKKRVVQALLILTGAAQLGTDEDEREVLGDLRELVDYGYGRLEVIVVDHRVEGINPTRTKKRRDWAKSPKGA